MLNNNQISAFVERIATVAVGYAVGAGYLSQDDTQVIVGMIVAVFSGTYAIWNNRQKRLAERAAATGLSVIAPDDIARNTRSPKIVSSLENEIVKK